MSMPVEFCFWDIIKQDFRWTFMGVKFKFDDLPLEIQKLKDSLKAWKIYFHGDFYGNEIYTEVMKFYSELKSDVVEPLEFPFKDIYTVFLNQHLKNPEESKSLDEYVLTQFQDLVENNIKVIFRDGVNVRLFLDGEGKYKITFSDIPKHLKGIISEIIIRYMNGLDAVVLDDFDSKNKDLIKFLLNQFRDNRIFEYKGKWHLPFIRGQTKIEDL